MINPAEMHKTAVSPSLLALNPGACLSPFLKITFLAFCSRLGPFICITNLLQQFPPPQWLRNGSCPMALGWQELLLLWSRQKPSCAFLKPKLFVKLSNHPLLASHFPALGPAPSFCFKSSHRDLAFSRVCRCVCLSCGNGAPTQRLHFQ